MSNVLVTGASTGIGHATAKRMLAYGWEVFAAARKDEDLAAVRDDPRFEDALR